MSKKYVYTFANGQAEGNTTMKDLLGGKGANLAEMTNAGLPVPPGFTITTEACNAYYASGEQFPEGMWDQALAALARTEEVTGKKFGGAENPLLVSVRSGAKFSMPGMMDTVLNLGLNDETVEVEAKIVDDYIDWYATCVWWHDNDILPLLHGSQLTAIETQFWDEYDDIVRFDQE